MLVQALPFGLMVAGLREEEEATGTRIQVVEEEGCRIAGDRGHTTSDGDVDEINKLFNLSSSFFFFVSVLILLYSVAMRTLLNMFFIFSPFNPEMLCLVNFTTF